jgi:hypothetical protein
VAALVERGEDAERGIEAGGDVGDGGAGAHRSASRLAGRHHEPAHALRDLVEPRALGVGAVLPEARDRSEDDAPVHLGERRVVDAEAVLHVRAEVLHHHVGALGEAHEDRAAFGLLEVERHRALVAVQVLHVETVARPAHGVELHRGRKLDLDHVGAEVGELLDAGGTCAHAREVEHTDARERGGCGLVGHGLY